MLFDTHCHYNLEPLSSNWQQHWARAKQHGVKKAVVVGSDFFTSSTATQIASADKDLYASIGIHPHAYDDQTDEADLATDRFELKLIAGPKVLAIGETGLDYFNLPKDKDKAEKIKYWQQQGFIMQIKLANQLNLPIIIHVRDAYQDALEILQKFKIKNNFVLHCMSGDQNYIQEAIELGAYFGVDGNINYQKNNKLRELLKLVPEDKLLLETDAPYLPPEPFRGKTCEPWMIAETAKYLANKFNLNLKNIYQNSLKFFNIK